MEYARPTPTNEALLAMRGISKSFPGVHALRGIDLDLHSGEVLALVGENGAGKSTLIKILGGAHLPDSGTIRLAGIDPSIKQPIDAQRAGISIIYQEFNLVPGLTARENIFLGREQAVAGLIPHGQEKRRAAKLFDRIGVAVDLETPCRDLSIAQQQVVEIAKALAQDARVIVMDEPSATLTPQEVERLFAVIRDLKRQGLGIIYISHRLEEVFEIADRVMVMRDGMHVATRAIREVTRDQLIEWMVGRNLESEFPARSAKLGEPRLVVKHLSRRGKVHDVSFVLRRGEIVGLTGLVGAGRTEMARLIFGADLADEGTVELDGRPCRIRNPRDAIRHGICLLTEDRKSEGLILSQGVRENFGLPNLRSWSRAGWIRRRLEREACEQYVQALRIRTSDVDQPARELSGGNQQKVVLAKWLQRNAEVILFDEPTRGIDVGAKYEIYLLMNELAARGKAILMISSELPEILGMSDRILVMHEGRISGEIVDVPHATQEQILRLAVQ